MLDLPDLTAVQLSAYAEASGHRRGLPETATVAVVAAISMTRSPNGALSLPTVNRMLDRAEMNGFVTMEPEE